MISSKNKPPKQIIKISQSLLKVFLSLLTTLSCLPLTIILPPRNEVVVQIQITNEVTEGIVSPRKLNDYVLLPSALVSIDKNKQAICTIFNISENFKYTQSRIIK